MKKLAQKIHRILSYLVFAQVFLWILGGVIFSVVPFDSVIKGGSVVSEAQAVELPDNWQALIEPHRTQVKGLKGVLMHASGQGDLLELQGAGESRWVRVGDGQQARKPDASEMGQFANSLYQGEGMPGEVRYLADSEYHYLGLVDELYGRTGVWQASFDDSLGTRLYFEGETGKYLTVRNDFWVFYDAMWRLHIMDYRNGSDFNNLLLVVFSLLSLGFAISGIILTWYAIKRVWNKGLKSL